MTNPNELYDEWIPGEGLRAYDTPRARAEREQKKTLSERQTWNFPPKPDVSVTHLRDVHGRVWERRVNGFWFRVGGPNMYGYSWYQLFITNAPLTDATGDDDD